ncbi:MAG: restriction endonuclease subunit R [Flavobacteriales bacterium]|nr:restriction endonuclease subunit R [Flavobacteriales bacterium]|tara:strand:+ start:2805 stop:3221 length:417 start_codon:yes stop_codon:yes gene_type:complete
MKLKIQNGQEYIFDLVRKKFVLNQPEEWVRQNFIKFLNEKKGYPLSLMSVEKKTNINLRQKRCDIICFDKNNQALLLVECKAQNIKLNQETINQSVIYQKKIKAQFIIITNGNQTYCFKEDNTKIEFIKKIPHYSLIE